MEKQFFVCLTSFLIGVLLAGIIGVRSLRRLRKDVEGIRDQAALLHRGYAEKIIDVCKQREKLRAELYKTRKALEHISDWRHDMQHAGMFLSRQARDYIYGWLKKVNQIQ